MNKSPLLSSEQLFHEEESLHEIGNFFLYPKKEKKILKHNDSNAVFSIVVFIFYGVIYIVMTGGKCGGTSRCRQATEKEFISYYNFRRRRECVSGLCSTLRNISQRRRWSVAKKD
jgi:hypothetical protein